MIIKKSNLIYSIADKIENKNNNDYFLFKKSEYTISEQEEVVFRDCKDAVIDGNGCTLNFVGKRDGLCLVNCENILLKNFVLDYADCFQICGRITESGVGYTKIRPYMPFKKEDLQGICEYLEFLPDEPKPDVEGKLLYNSGFMEMAEILPVEIQGDELVVRFSHDKRISKVGNQAAMCFVMYGNSALRFEHCKGVRAENITVHMSPGMAVYAEYSENLEFDHYKLMLKPNSGRLMTCSADGMHFKDCRGTLEVRNSLFENSHDDAFNCAGMYMEVLKKENGMLTVCSPLGKDLTYTPRVGDRLEIADKNTLDVRGHAVVESVSECESGILLKLSGDAVAEVGNLLGNENGVPQIVFENNIVRNKRNRGLLVQARGCILRNNVFDTVLHGAVSIIVEVNTFFESIAPSDIVVEGNRFLNCNLEGDADIAAVAFLKGFELGKAGVIRHLRIADNVMEGSYQSGISLASVDDAQVVGNTIKNCGRKPRFKKFESAISLENCNNIQIENNRIENPPGIPDVYIRNCSDVRIQEVKDGK